MRKDAYQYPRGYMPDIQTRLNDQRRHAAQMEAMEAMAGPPDVYPHAPPAPTAETEKPQPPLVISFEGRADGPLWEQILGRIKRRPRKASNLWDHNAP